MATLCSTRHGKGRGQFTLGRLQLATCVIAVILGVTEALLSPVAKFGPVHLGNGGVSTGQGQLPRSLTKLVSHHSPFYGGMGSSSSARSLLSPMLSMSMWSRPQTWKKRREQEGAVELEPLPFPPASSLLRPTVKHSLTITAPPFEPNELGRLRKLWRGLAFKRPFISLSKNCKVVTIDLEGSIPYWSEDEGLFGGEKALSLVEVKRTLATAAIDPRIKGIIVKAGSLTISTPTIVELRRMFENFRQSGKQLVGYIDGEVTVNTLCVLAGCGKVAAVPESYISLAGFSFSSDYYKPFLDKVGIEAQVVRIGEFKSFGDSFTRSTMSDAEREVLETLLSAVSDFKLGLLGQRSREGMASQEMEDFLNKGVLNVEDLVKVGLVDEMMYEDEVEYQLQCDLTDITSSNKRAKKNFTVAMKKYLRRTGRMRFKGLPGDEGDVDIAVISAEGPIGGAWTAQFRDDVSSAIDDDKIMGVVIRIDCPGGDALDSDKLWKEVMAIKDADKPVVASIGGCAASGGYYIAMACDNIVCEELSITGSIGVVLSKFSLGKLLDKVGFKTERISRGRYAELSALERSFTPDEDRFWKKMALDSYDSFVSKAAKNRAMSKEDMQRRAQGRVWTGAQAKALNLVDTVGGIDTAIEVCRELVDDRAYERMFKRELKKSFPSNLKKENVNLFKELGYKMTPDGPIGSLGSAYHTTKGKREWEELASDLELAAKSKMNEEKVGVLLSEVRTALENVEEYFKKTGDKVNKKLERAREKSEEKLGGRKKMTKIRHLADEAFPSLSLPSLPSPLPGFLSARMKLVRGFGAKRYQGVSTTARGPLLPLLEALGDLKTMMGRPLYLMDETVGQAMPEISGVPDTLARLGVGPLLNHVVSQSPGLLQSISTSMSLGTILCLARDFLKDDLEMF